MKTLKEHCTVICE